MFAWMKDTITRIRPSTKVSRGSQIPDWENATELTIGSCSMQPASTSLNTDGRVLGVSDGYTLYAPMNADIKAGDRIVYNGEPYTINGEPRPWQSPFGEVEHLVVNLMRYYG
jgi:hypothetical protein